MGLPPADGEYECSQGEVRQTTGVVEVEVGEHDVSYVFSPKAKRLIRTRRCATSARTLLDSFGDDRCVQILTRLLEDPVPRVRAIAPHALVCEACKLTPPQSRPDLLALTIDWAANDPHRRVKQEAIRVLAESNQPEAIMALRTLGVRPRAPAVRRTIPRRFPAARGAPPRVV